MKLNLANRLAVSLSVAYNAPSLPYTTLPTNTSKIYSSNLRVIRKIEENTSYFILISHLGSPCTGKFSKNLSQGLNIYSEGSRKYH